MGHSPTIQDPKSIGVGGVIDWKRAETAPAPSPAPSAPVALPSPMHVMEEITAPPVTLKPGVNRLGLKNEPALKFSVAEEVWLLSLARRQDRRERALKACESVGIVPKVFSAFDGKTLPLQNPASESYRRGPKRPMNAAEIACFLSHAAILRQAMSAGVSSLLVLEDDIVFADCFLERFRMMWQECPSDMDICYGSNEGVRTMPTMVSERVHRHHHSWVSIFVLYQRSAMEAIINHPDFAACKNSWDDFLMFASSELGLHVYGPRDKIVWSYDIADSDIDPKQ